ncbi:FAD-dependent oxidoreductase [Streptomyces boninensis]|uniref:FAD-dependent oxidoreductase n=1 Tax=Streptomyces boninensis TaxID=2039455 RepID=UPI003B2264A4
MISRRSLIRTGAGAGAAAALAATGSTAVLAGAGTASAVPAWDSLSSGFDGTLVLPGSPGYDQAVQLHKAQFDAVHPQAVAYCTSAADIAACIRFSQDYSVPSAVRSGGHSNAGYSTTPGLIIDTSRLNSVRASGSTVRLGPGAQGIDIVSTLSALGLQAPTGTCPTVAMGGWLQGGGVGPAARKHGLGADRLVSAKVVLASGRTVTASATQNADLYWALRGGGGGNFGVVTEYEIRPVQTPVVSLFNLAFDWADAVDLVQAWQARLAVAPRELDTHLFVTWPTDAGGTPSVVVGGSYLGTKAAADAELDKLLTALGRPAKSRQCTELGYQQAMMTLFGCADKTVPECHRIGYSPEAVLPREYNATYRHVLAGTAYSRTAIQDLLARMEHQVRAKQFRFIGLFAFGGRINDAAKSSTAYVHRDTLFEIGMQIALTTQTPSDDDKAAGAAWINGTFDTAEPHSNHEIYQNFMDPAVTNWREAYYGSNHTRLQSVKRTYDPYRFFSFAQAI